MARKPRTSKAKPDPARRVIESALDLARERGWRDLTLGEIAAAAKLPLSEVYDQFPSKNAILTAFVRGVDHAVLAESGDLEEGLSARDRLFDVLMRRFDTLQPHREALANIAQDLACDPLELCCSGKRLRRSMACMLTAADLSPEGCRGCFRIEGLLAIYLYALRVWFRDDSEDQGKTMAALDKALRRAEMLLGRMPAGLGR